MSYTPQSGSMVSKLIDFFNVNGDEELTADDIAAKFSVSAAGVHSCLYKAIESGLIVRKKNDDGEYVYAHPAGTKTKSPAPWPSTPPRPWAAPIAAPVKPKRQAHTIDLSALELETDVPITTARQSLDWPGLFSRMKPGQSCVLPKSAAYTRSKAMTDYKKAGLGELQRKAINDEQFRLWRLV